MSDTGGQTAPGSGQQPPGAAPPPSPPAASAQRKAVMTRWGGAIFGAVLTTVVLLALSEAIVFLAVANAPTKPPTADVLRAGAIGFYQFNRVGLVVHVPHVAGVGNIFGGAAPSQATVTVAILGGMFLAMWLLARTGRILAKGVPGPVWVRGLAGAKVGVPYAAICFAASYAVKFSIPVPPLGQPVTLVPSHVAALLWPLAFGLVFGFIGGLRLRSPGTEAAPASSVERWIRGGVAGGLAMIVFGLTFAFVGLLVMAVVQPDATRAYFHGVTRAGTQTSVGLIAATALAVPNLTSWILLPSMGACLNASVGGLAHFCVLSYSHFPRSGGTQIGSSVNGFSTPSLPAPSAPYFAFILAPALAVISGGAIAMRRSGATTRRDGAVAGIVAGLVFAFLAGGLAIVSGFVVKAGGAVPGFGFGATFRLGPDLTSATLLALVWGVVGGLVGAMMRARSLPAAVRPAPVATPPPEPPPTAPPQPPPTAPPQPPPTAPPQPPPTAPPEPPPTAPPQPPPTAPPEPPPTAPPQPPPIAPGPPPEASPG